MPVLFALPETVGSEDALLIEAPPRPGVAAFMPSAAHEPGCACCAVRLPAGRALAELLHDRARARVPFFRRVVVAVQSEAGRREVIACLSSDPVVASCYRLVNEIEP